MEIGIIYCATNLTNGKMYIGQTIKKLEYRSKEHFSSIRDKNINYKFANALRKYKPEDWKWEILVDNVPVEQLDLFERSYIWALSTFEFGYNSTTGGEGGFIRSEETKRKISLSKIGKSLSEKHKNNISVSNTGKTRTKETRHKMSVSQKGKPKSEETKKKISIANKGKKRTEDMNKRNSIAHSGENHSFFGKTHSQESKTKMSLVKSIYFYRITKPNGEIEIIKNLARYCKESELDCAAMCAIVNGRRKSHKGYRVEKISKKEALC